jgi:hypothetical protein
MREYIHVDVSIYVYVIASVWVNRCACVCVCVCVRESNVGSSLAGMGSTSVVAHRIALWNRKACRLDRTIMGSPFGDRSMSTTAHTKPASQERVPHHTFHKHPMETEATHLDTLHQPSQTSAPPRPRPSASGDMSKGSD